MAITRRQFITGAVGAGAAGAVGVALSQSPWQARGDDKTAATTTTVPTASSKGTLVLVTLYGGNDGLDTVIPFEDARYLGARGELGNFSDGGHPDGAVIPLADGLALHPALTGLKRLWDARQLAIVRGVGYPAPNRSHFVSMDIWQSGSTDGGSTTGWLGPWLDATGTDPLRAIAVGANVPRILRGEKASATAVPLGPFALPGTPALKAAFGSMQHPDGFDAPLAAAIARSGADLLTTGRTIADVVAGRPESEAGAANLEGVADGADRPGHTGELGEQLSLVARLIKADLPTTVYSVGLGGFDTHANEKAVHAQLLGQLDASITRFFADLEGDPHREGVVMVAYSEFGRRVAANASGGTDHGAAGPVLVAGPRVKGGTFYGDEPSLVDLDDGDLKHTTDFRSVYATVLEGIVGFDARRSLGGPYPRLDLL